MTFLDRGIRAANRLSMVRVGNTHCSDYRTSPVFVCQSRNVVTDTKFPITGGGESESKSEREAGRGHTFS